MRKVIAIPGSFVGQATLTCTVNNVNEVSLPLTGNLLGKVALVAVVSSSPQAAQFLTGSSAGTGGEPVMPERILASSLPTDANLLDSLTAITMTPQSLATLTSRQQSALYTWVTLGGVLLITGTSSQHQFGSFALPLSQTATKSGPALPLVSFTGDATADLTGKIPLSGALVDKQADVLAGTAKNPYIAESLQGRGVVLQTAFSPTSIITWQGNAALWTKLIGTGLLDAHPVFPHLNGSDGVYTLTNAGNSLSPLRVPSLKFWGSIFLLYVLAIGPVLFYFLRITKREPWGWLILPVVSLVTTAAIYGFGVSQRPNGLLAEGVGVLELNGQGQAVSYGMTGFTSPFVTRAKAAAGGVQFVLPIAGSTDKHPDGESVMAGNANVNFTGIPRWGVRYVYSAGTVSHQGSFVATLQNTAGMLTGSITNETPYAIHNAALVWGGNVFELKTLNPGDTVWIDGQTAKLSFKDAWLPTYSRYNGDLTHGLGRVLGSYLAEQSNRPLTANQAFIVGTDVSYSPPGAKYAKHGRYRNETKDSLTAGCRIGSAAGGRDNGRSD